MKPLNGVAGGAPEFSMRLAATWEMEACCGLEARAAFSVFFPFFFFFFDDLYAFPVLQRLFLADFDFELMLASVDE